MATGQATTPNFVLETKVPSWDIGTVSFSNLGTDRFRAQWTGTGADTNFDSYVLKIRPRYGDGSVGQEYVWDKEDDATLGNPATLLTDVTDAPVAEVWIVDFWARDTYGFWKFACTKILDTKLPIPTDFRCSGYTITSIILQWKNNSYGSESGTQIWRSPNGYTEWTRIDGGTVGTGVETFEDTSLTEDVTYWYKIRLYDATGTGGFTSKIRATPRADLQVDIDPDNFDVRVFIEDNNGNWVDFTDRSEAQGKDLLLAIGRIQYGVEGAHAQFLTKPGSLKFMNADGFFDIPFPDSLRVSYNSEWEEIDQAASFSISYAGGETALFGHKLAIRIRVYHGREQVPVDYPLAVMQLQNLSTDLVSEVATVKFVGLARALMDLNAEDVKDGRAPYKNRSTSFLVTKLLEKHHSSEEIATFSIDQVVDLQVGEGFWLSALSRPPERMDTGEWVESHYITRAVQTIDGYVYLGADEHVFKYDPGVNTYTALTNIASPELGEGYYIRRLWVNQTWPSSVRLWGVAWKFDSTERNVIAKIFSISTSDVLSVQASGDPADGALYEAELADVFVGDVQIREGVRCNDTDGYDFAAVGFHRIYGRSLIWYTPSMSVPLPYGQYSWFGVDQNTVRIKSRAKLPWWVTYQLQYDYTWDPNYIDEVYNARKGETRTPRRDFPGNMSAGAITAQTCNYQTLDLPGVAFRWDVGARGLFEYGKEGAYPQFLFASYDEAPGQTTWDEGERVYFKWYTLEFSPTTLVRERMASTAYNRYNPLCACFDWTGELFYFSCVDWVEKEPISPNIAYNKRWGTSHYYLVKLDINGVAETVTQLKASDYQMIIDMCYNEADTTNPLHLAIYDTNTVERLHFLFGVHGTSPSGGHTYTQRGTGFLQPLTRLTVASIEPNLNDQTYFVEQGSGRLLRYDYNKEEYFACAAGQSIGDESFIISNIAADTSNQLLYMISSPSPPPETQGQIIAGRYNLCRYGSDVALRVELGSFTDLTIWKALGLLAEMSNCVIGYDEAGLFYFRSRDWIEAADYSFDLTDDEEIDVKKGRGWDRIYNKSIRVPYVVQMGDPEMNVIVKPRSDWDNSTGATVQQADTQARSIRMTCIRGGFIGQATFKYRTALGIVGSKLLTDYVTGETKLHLDTSAVVYIDEEIQITNSSGQQEEGIKVGYQPLDSSDLPLTLTQELKAEGNTITVSFTGLTVGDIVRVNVEYMLLTANPSGNTFIVTRSYFAETLGTHAQGSKITIVKSGNYLRIAAPLVYTYAVGSEVLIENAYESKWSTDYEDVDEAIREYRPLPNEFCEIGSSTVEKEEGMKRIRSQYSTNVSIKFVPPPNAGDEKAFSEGDLVTIECPGLRAIEDPKGIISATDLVSSGKWNIREYPQSKNRFVGRNIARLLVRKDIADHSKPKYNCPVTIPFALGFRMLHFIDLTSQTMFERLGGVFHGQLWNVTYDPGRGRLQMQLKGTTPY